MTNTNRLKQEIRFQQMIGRIVIHFKQFNNNGDKMLYRVNGLCRHTETGELLVSYQALYGDEMSYVRPYDMFMSEVERDKYPNATQKYRLEIYNEE